jgi:hypothetical protein
MASPGRGASQPGLSWVQLKHSAKGPVSRILSCAVIPLGAALPRTLISDLPGGFGHCMEQPLRAPRDATRAALWRRAGATHEPCSGLMHPSLFGLAPCGVYPAPAVTGRAVRSYRTISPLPRREDLSVQANLKGVSGCPLPESGGVAEAVSFLWHWPSAGLEAHIPDVIRHTALRSSDFPPPANIPCETKPAATARSSCQSLV